MSGSGSHNYNTPVSDTSSSDQEEGEAIGREIEKTIHHLVDSLNNRTLDANDPYWSDRVDPNFRAVALPPHKFNFQRWVAHMNGLTETFPAYDLRIANINTEVFIAHGYARTFVDFEATGIPEGVVRRSVTIDEFRLRNGKWRWFSGQAMDGHEMGHTKHG